MEDYNRLISAKVLDGYEAMLDNVPQPQMLGGKRMRKFVLPASTEYDYPGTLSVGRMDGNKPATLGGDFWSDFGDGFPDGSLQGSGMCGGATWVGQDGKIHSTGMVYPKGRKGGKFNIGKAFKSVGKELAPVGKELGTTLLKEGAKEGIKQMLKPQNVEMMAEEAPMMAAGRKRGGKKFNLGKALKPVAPIAKELGMTLAKEGIKEGVKSYAKSGSKGGRRKKGILHSVGKVLGSVGKELAPVAKEVFRDVIVPEGKKALKEYIRDSLKAKPTDDNNSANVAYGMGRKPRGRPPKMMVGTDPRTYTPQHLLAEGGVLIRNAPNQFHSSVYPPALASYAHSFPAGHDAYGRGLPRYSKSPISKPFTAVKKATGGARAARGAIVKEVMAKHGLSLPEASKFVKEKGLY